MNKSYGLTNILLLLFIAGMILLGLFGYGKYSYISYARKITPPNPAILVFAIPMILPYIIKSFADFFLSKNVDKQGAVLNTTNLLEKGASQKIIFKNDVTEMIEMKAEDHSDFEILKGELLFPYQNFFKSEVETFTRVTLKYTANTENYYKQITLPLTLENASICLKMQVSTFLYYDKNNPENAIVDLKFLEKFL